MVRTLRTLPALTAVFFALTAAETILADVALQRLRVESFTFAADTAHPVVEHPFHLLLTVRVAERVPDLRNVILPTFVGIEPLGDESALVPVGSGTEYRERITVIAHRSGTIHISPPYLDAIDARDDLPKRFFANPLVLDVAGPLASAREPFVALVNLRELARASGWILFVALLGLLFVRRLARPAPTRHAAEATDALPSPHDTLHALRAALAHLEEHPTRSAVLALRMQLRAWAGIPVEATLIDALARIHEREGPLRAALIAIERAAFCKDDVLEDAIHDAILAVERLVR